MTHILIADPDPTLSKALSLVIQHKLGINNIIEVSDLWSLIHALTDTPPDIILLDWRLYSTPPPVTCRLLKKAYPNLKVILLSVDANDATAAKEGGATFIHKGASPDELIETLEAYILEENTSEKETSFQE